MAEDPSRDPSRGDGSTSSATESDDALTELVDAATGGAASVTGAHPADIEAFDALSELVDRAIPPPGRRTDAAALANALVSGGDRRSTSFVSVFRPR